MSWTKDEIFTMASSKILHLLKDVPKIEERFMNTFGGSEKRSKTFSVNQHPQGRYSKNGPSKKRGRIKEKSEINGRKVKVEV